MARLPNPFKPGAGANPPQLVGRSQLIDDFIDSLADGPGAPGRVTIFTGPRGVGKTVMLGAVAQQAEVEFQWLTIHETATQGLVERLTRQLQKLAKQLPGDDSHRALTGVTLPVIGGGIQLAQPSPAVSLDLRESATNLLDRLAACHTGLLITVDEVHADVQEEMRHFATMVQHLIREDREIAVAMAGLPHAISELLNDKVTTFLRRAERHVLTNLSISEVREALANTITANGRQICSAGLTKAAEATGGYPFLVQLVGYQIWRQTSSATISLDDVEAGVNAALTRFEQLVHEPALASLTAVDRSVVAALAQLPGPASTAQLAEIVGNTSNYLAVYRERLTAAGIVAPTRPGQIDFALPHLRQYVRAQIEQGRW
jgi:predicted ATPase